MNERRTNKVYLGGAGILSSKDYFNRDYKLGVLGPSRYLIISLGISQRS
jgi:hypothetical protein